MLLNEECCYHNDNWKIRTKFNECEDCALVAKSVTPLDNPNVFLRSLKT